jgi:hypothetical protein
MSVLAKGRILYFVAVVALALSVFGAGYVDGH